MPTEEQTYREGQREKFDRFEKDVRESLSRIETAQDTLDKNQKFTNGKVRKIIIALVLLGGIVIGMNSNNWHDIIALFAGGVSIN